MIQVEGLTKYYGSYKAVDRISFHADRGEVIGFVGRNGAGKTTTIRILTGYMPPSEGKAVIAGYDVFEESLQVRQRIGYLPETVPLYKEMTVWQYVEYMASLRGMRGDERMNRVETVLSKVNMLDREDSLIASLSKGMRQRIGLAQAIVHNPEVLIMDEPMIGLDPDQRADMRGIIEEIGENRTVFLSSHDLAELEKLADRVLMIHKGKIVAEDHPETLATRLEGERRFFVRVGGVSPDEVAGALSGIDQVIAARPTEEGVEVSSHRDDDARPMVAAAIVNQSWDLLELKPLGYSLEDIFLQLTAEDEPTYGYADEEEDTLAYADDDYIDEDFDDDYIDEEEEVRSVEGINRSLSSLWVVAKHEFQLLFSSPIMYLVGAAWLFFNGLFFSLTLAVINQGQAESSMAQTLNTMTFMLLFFAPAMTMRSVSEELSSGTHELLLTSPVRDWEIIVGKWLGIYAAFTLFVIVSLICPLIFIWRGNPDIASMAISYLGLWLAGGTTLALGVLASSLTQYQLVAFFVSLVTLIGLWLTDAITQIVTNPTASEILGELSLLSHTRNFLTRPLINPVDVAYFIGLSAIALFIATQVLGSRRWSG